ncbi:MAG: DUF4440 domain-containing protein [Pseudomonadota bacterium]
MFLIALLALSAPIPDVMESTRIIVERDAALFEMSFERCDPEVYRTYFDDDFRMLHDLAGEVAANADAFVANYERDCARKPGDAPAQRRELLPGSRKVQLLGTWGALEEGLHTFHEQTADGVWRQTGSARYIHVWRWTGETFVLDQSLSVDHGS